MQALNPAYVYLVKHIPTGKFYYGSRYNHIKLGLSPSDDLWVKYFTSSKEVKSLLKESPLTDFKVDILFTSYDHDLCFKYEQSLIKENIDDILCLNKRYFDSKKDQGYLGHMVKLFHQRESPSLRQQGSECQNQKVRVIEKISVKLNWPMAETGQKLTAKKQKIK